jgi:hypothetical protein
VKQFVKRQAPRALYGAQPLPHRHQVRAWFVASHIEGLDRTPDARELPPLLGYLMEDISWFLMVSSTYFGIT